MQMAGFPERLGNALIEGLAEAWEGPQAQTFERGIALLCRHVGGDAAAWGLIEGPLDVGAAPSFHLAGAWGLSDELRQSYLAVYGDDRFAATVLERPGEVMRWSAGSNEEPPNVRAWVERHRLAHGAAICLHEPFSGQTLVVALYRFDGGPAFSDDDATLLRFMVQQLVLLWRRSLQETFNAASARSLSRTLLAKADGTLLFCGAEFAERLVALGWDQQGRRVPEKLLHFGKAGGRLRIGADWAVVSEDADGLRAELATAAHIPPLPTRMLRVAALSCDGLTAKQIAQELNLSPATVRTYLRDAYGMLGVRNKLELQGAMRLGRLSQA